MSIISPQRVRFRVNVSRRTLGVDVLTSETARVLKPADVQFEIGLFNDDEAASEPLDIAGLASITLAVKPARPRTAAAKFSQQLLAVGLNDELTLADWNGGDAEDCHALFQFSADDLDFDLGADELAFYVVLSGLTDGDPAKPLVFGNGRLVIEDSGVKLT
jgi:hypothetical protein